MQVIEDEDLDQNDHDDLEYDEDAAAVLEAEGHTGAVGFLLGFTLGAVVGAGIALVLAPAGGKVTRRRLTGLVRELKDDATDRFGDVQEDLGKKVKRERRRMKRRLERYRS